jgi:type IV fimbrial biogenesis protein FimT
MENRSGGHSPDRGFTLIELMVTLAVAAILLALAVPSFKSLIDKYKLTSAVDTLYSDFQFARGEAIRNNQNVYISFQSGTAWCYGMVLGNAACSCSQTTASASDYCGLKLVSAGGSNNVSIPGASSITFNANQTGFEPARGITLNGNTGYVMLQSGLGLQARVNLSVLGRISVCSPAGSGYTGAYPSC